jgi:hypothetical protein
MIITGKKRTCDEQKSKESNESRKKCLASETSFSAEERSENNDVNGSVNAIESGDSLDLNQIKGYLTSQLTQEH